MSTRVDCVLPSFKDAFQKKKLEEAQRALIVRRMKSTTDKQHLRDQTSSKLSVTLNSGSRDMSRRKRFGYFTLLDISLMNRTHCSDSRDLPTYDFVPNSYHQDFHLTRWTSWMKRTPKWFLKEGMHGLCSQGNKQKTCQDDAVDNNKENNIEVQHCAVEKNTKGTSCQKEHQVKEWRDWSLRLTATGRFVVTGRVDSDLIKKSRNVSFCKRIDARTLLHHDGTVYKLVGAPRHFLNVPHYVREKFNCGFPDDWREVKLLWEIYLEQGSPSDFSWTTDAQVPTSKNTNNIAFHPVKEDGTHVKSAARSLSKAMQRATDRSQHTIAQECDKQLNAEVLSGAQVEVQPDPKEVEKCSEWLDTIQEDECGAQEDPELVERHSEQPEIIQDEGCDAQSDPKVVEANSVVPKYSEQLNITVTQPVSRGHHPTNVNGARILLPRLTLHRWTPILQNQHELKIRGYLQNSQFPIVCHTTDIVKSRKKNGDIQCFDGTVYTLVHPCALPGNTIPRPFVKQRGLPLNWRQVLRNWYRAQRKRTEPNTINDDDSLESSSSMAEDGTSECKGAVVMPPCVAGSLIPLKPLEGKGTVQRSLRGRLRLPPLRYWLGEKVVQRGSEAMFFTPELGATEIVIKTDLNHQKEFEMHMNKRKRHVASQQGDMKRPRTKISTSESRNDRGQPRRQPNGHKFASHSSHAPHSKDVECGRGAEEHEFLMPMNTKVAVVKRKNTNVRDGNTTRQTEDRQPSFRICDDEEDIFSQEFDRDKTVRDLMSLNVDYQTVLQNLSAAYSPVSSKGETPPVKLIASTQPIRSHVSATHSPELLLEPERRKSDVQRFVKRQQKLMEKEKKIPFSRMATTKKLSHETKMDRLKTVNERVNKVFSVQYNIVEDCMSSIDEEDFSNSYVSGL